MPAPLCKNCKHVVPSPHANGIIDKYARCAIYPKDRSLVSGEELNDNFASAYRLPSQECGPDGSLFEPK